MPPTITEKHPPLSWEILHSAANAIFVDNDVSAAKQCISLLVETHPIVSHAHGPGQVFWRVRPATGGKPFTHVDELLWPPKPNVSMGRANHKEEPLLYISDRRDTALTEIFDDNGGAAHFVGIGIQPTRTVKLAMLGEIFHIYRTGKGLLSSSQQAHLFTNMLNACSSDEARRLVLTDSILFDAFFRHENYEVTAHLAKVIRDKQPGIDGIVYRSVPQYGGLNIALRPDAYHMNWGIRSSFYAAKCSHIMNGMWSIEERTDVTGIFDDGKFQFAAEKQSEDSCLLLEPAFTGGGHPY